MVDQDIDSLEDVEQLRALLLRERRLREYTRIVQSTVVPLKSTLQQVCSMLKKDIACTAVAIRLPVVSSPGTFPFLHSDGFSAEFTKSEECTLNCFCSIALAPHNTKLPFQTNNRSLVVNDAQDFKQQHAENSGVELSCKCSLFTEFNSFAVVPLQVDDQVLGLLQLADNKKNIFTSEVLQLIESVACVTSMALKNSAEYIKLKIEFSQLSDSLQATAPGKGSDSKNKADFEEIFPALLSGIGLAHYIEIFNQHNISLSELSHLSREKLQLLGLSPESVEKLISRTSGDRLMELQNVVLKDELGRGSFTECYRGIWHGTTVAIKQFCSPIDAKTLYSDMAVLHTLHHPNIVQFFGVATLTGKLSLVSELCENSVKDLLASETLSFATLLLFARDLAAGLAYLSSCGIVHGCLCAKSLVYQTGSKGYQVKVNNYGIRHLSQAQLLNPEAARWAAPETFNGSIGVSEAIKVVWELFSFGALPYSVEKVEVSNIKQFVLDGNRLGMQGLCTERVYALMQQCWELNPQLRPDFQYLFQSLNWELLQVPATDTCCVVAPGTFSSSSSTSGENDAGTVGYEDIDEVVNATVTTENEELVAHSPPTKRPRVARK